jgi:lipopolysaccharide export system permease protein
LGILQRYVLGEILRSFSLALLTMSSIFVLFMVAVEARSALGLTPQDIMQLVPFIIPSTLPYTIPVSLLFSVTVVYGRLAADNEIIAVKTSGQSVLTVLWPAIVLGASLTGAMFYLSRTWVPACTHMAKMVLFKDVEDSFYKVLKANREFSGLGIPFLIKVSDVDGRVMKDATIKHRKPGNEKANEYDFVVFAEKAVLNFDVDQVPKMVRIHLDKAEIQYYERESSVILIDGRTLEIPIPDDREFGGDKKIQEYTNAEIEAELAKYRGLIHQERLSQTYQAGLAFASGRLDQINWAGVQNASTNYSYWLRKSREFETERELRTAMSFGSLLFVVLGAPVGIIFARRDFLSAFIVCFVPIIILYYPLTLVGVNLGKEGLLNPTIALWIGNGLLGLFAGFFLPPVMRH